MRGRDPAVVLSVACDIAVVLRNELRGARRSDSREGGNRKRVHSNEMRHLQPKQVPQECLMDFRLQLRPPNLRAGDLARNEQGVRSSRIVGSFMCLRIDSGFGAVPFPEVA